MYRRFFMSESNSEALFMIMATLGILLGIFIILAIVWGILSYIFSGLGLMEMDKKKNEKYPWLSWIPCARTYLIGKLAYGETNGGVLFLVASIGVTIINLIICNVVSFVSGVGSIAYSIAEMFSMILNVGYLVFLYITYYRIYKQFSKNYTLMLVFTILTSGILAPVFIFAIRNNNLIEYNNMSSNKNNCITTSQQNITSAQQDNHLTQQSINQNMR